MWIYLAAAIFVVGMAFFVARQDERAAQQRTRTTTNSNESNASTKPNENQANENVTNTEGNTPSWFGFFRWPNGTTTWAIIFTLLAVADQARESARATQALRESIPHQQKAAEAASRNTEALINAERAWVTATVKKTIESVPVSQHGLAVASYENVSFFHFVLTNLGRTPAEIFAVRAKTEPKKGIDGGFASDEEPVYNSTNLQHVRLLAPKEEWEPNLDTVNLFWRGYPDVEKEKIRSTELRIIFWGVVLYRDQFRPDVTHETRFCYTYLRGIDEYVSSGPPQYTKYT